MVKISIDYLGELRCQATHGPSGQKLLTDAPADNHGKAEYFSPTDLVATAFGTCIATVMGIVADRDGINLDGFNLEVIKEMTASGTRRIASLKTKIFMPPSLTQAQRNKLEVTARHCPVNESLLKDINGTLEFIYPD